MSNQELFIESDSQANRKDTDSLNENRWEVESEDVTEKIEKVTIVYDTSKPVELTGKRPVISETKKSTMRESNKKKEEINNTSFNQSSTEQSNDSTKINIEKRRTKIRSKKRQLLGKLVKCFRHWLRW